MAIVNVSLDTGSRQSVLTIDGVIVPADDFSVEKYTFDGETVIGFAYTIESIDANGMKERRRFYLPSLEEIATVAHKGLNEAGLASQIIHDDDKAKADVIKYMSQSRNSE